MDSLRLSFANGIWVDKSLPLKHSYKQILENVFKATCKQVDFQTKAAEVINEVNLWVKNETNGLIKQILPRENANSLTGLIFVNAIHFKGAWDEKFYIDETKDFDFYLENGSCVKIPFMSNRKNQLIKSYDCFKVLGLPYRQRVQDTRRFTMYIFIPDAKYGLKDLVEKVGSESDFLERHLPVKSIPVGEFRIPRFKISFGFEASEFVKGLDLVLPFAQTGITDMP